ncbi:FBD-associated F-box protein At3g52670-like [Rutidosis leptorrhynchoides]|uniref:FBD-associated F-box protein At3g52670-like n=1 Tax=Rutidosis leptorrhynchoides TaxID=125765 RepID=UPI003A991061
METEGCDRLSSLPDDLINEILSYNDTKHAIKTSILSRRWKNTWKSIKHLSLSSDDVTSLPKFSECVTRVLSSRNNETDLSSVRFSFRGEVSQSLVGSIMDYAFSHNVQKMTIMSLRGRKIEFPASLFISETLKDLSLIGSYGYIKITLSTWNLVGLTTMHLHHVIFSTTTENPDECGGFFSTCPNLKNLTLTYCLINGSNDFTLSHSQLSNLRIENGEWYPVVVNVVTPQLKDLIVVNCRGEVMVSAPELSSLTYECHPDEAHAPKIIDFFQQCRNVQFLMLGLEIVEVLASNVQLVSYLPSPFVKLKCFKIYPTDLRSEEVGQKKINMPTEVKNYLLHASPTATVTIVSRQEVQVLQNAELAQKLMSELQMLVEHEKVSCETFRRTHTDVDVSKEPVRMSCIPEFWNEQFVEIIQCEDTIGEIMLMLAHIQDLLKLLPASSEKDKIETRYPSLHAEASCVIKLLFTNISALNSAFLNLMSHHMRL